MSLKDQLTEEMKLAMKARDELRLSAIRQVRSTVKNREIDQKRPSRRACAASAMPMLGTSNLGSFGSPLTANELYATPRYPAVSTPPLLRDTGNETYGGMPVVVELLFHLLAPGSSGGEWADRMSFFSPFATAFQLPLPAGGDGETASAASRLSAWAPISARAPGGAWSLPTS